LKIDLSPLATLQKEIVTASLSFYRIAGHTSPTSLFDLSEIEKEWDPEKVTWDNPPVFTAHISIAEAPGNVDSSWIEFDVTSTIKGYLAEPEKNKGLAVHIHVDDMHITLLSSEADAVNLRPKLEVHYNDSSATCNNKNSFSDNNIKIIKNPGSYAVYITNSLMYSDLEIYSVSGKKVASRQLINDTHLYVIQEYLSSGLYIIRLKSKTGYAHFRVSCLK